MMLHYFKVVGNPVNDKIYDAAWGKPTRTVRATVLCGLLIAWIFFIGFKVEYPKEFLYVTLLSWAEYHASKLVQAAAQTYLKSIGINVDLTSEKETTTTRQISTSTKETQS
jgi:hypothetical protein